MEFFFMKTAFVFSGQGAQSVGMGKDLYESSAAAKAVFDEADSVLGWSVSDVCFNGPVEKLTESLYCQAAIYTTSMACLAAYLEKNPGVTPVAVGGLSLGEYAALASAGYFSFADGLRLVAKRGELMDKCCRENPGTMASVLGGEPTAIAEACAEADIDVANYNCPGQIVISGVKEGVEKAAVLIKEKGAKRIIPLNVAGGFHSRLMKQAGEELGAVLADVPVKSPSVFVVQNFTGTIADDVDAIKANLVSQVAGSVRWDSCVRVMKDVCGAEAFVEFGPGSVVSGLVRKTVSDVAVSNVATVADLEKTAV